MATSRPASAASTAWTAPASGRRVAPSRTSTANGGRRWSAARWRASEAMKSRRSLLDRPATMTPQTPIARARVSVSASTRDPTTRIVPADPTSRPPERSSPSTPAWSRPRVGPPRATIPRMPAPGRPDRDPGPRPHVAHDPRDRRLDRIRDVARGDPPAPVPLEHVLAARAALVAPARLAAPARPGPGRSRAVGQLDSRRDAGRAAARRWAPRRRPNRRPTRADDPPARARTGRRPGR